VGIVRQHIPDPGISLVALPGERLIAALPGDHPLSLRDSFGLEALKDEDFVFLRRTLSPTYYDLLLQACHAAGFSPRIVQEASDPPSLIGLVSAGLFVALVPRSAAAAPRPHVAYREIADLTATVGFSLAFRAHGHDLVVQRFCDAAQDAVADSQGDGPLYSPPVFELTRQLV
jgi:DNA-binding transcriptional LysR family regulator